MAWILTSRAVHMCRTLGLHQASSSGGDNDPDETTDKRLIFWCTYMLDKGLSLRMGRASSLQDYDISQPPVIERAYAPYPGREVLTLWIRHARCQGRLYERLYSPAALLQQDIGARIEQVGILSAEINELLAETLELLRRMGEKERREEEQDQQQGGRRRQQQQQQQPLPKSRSSAAAAAATVGESPSLFSSSSTSASPPNAAAAATAAKKHRHKHPRLHSTETQLYVYILKSDEVSYLSSLTLAYRALPPLGARSRTFADECIDAAREAMRSHQETMNMVEDEALKIGHLHW